MLDTLHHGHPRIRGPRHVGGVPGHPCGLSEQRERLGGAFGPRFFPVG
jgi:hypothetical protein